MRKYMYGHDASLTLIYRLIFLTIVCLIAQTKMRLQMFFNIVTAHNNISIRYVQQLKYNAL